MNNLKAGSSVHYLAHPEWGPGRVQWITRTGLLMVRFIGAKPMYEGEFHAGELEGHVATGGSRMTMHPATEAILRYFAYEHLPPHLGLVSQGFHVLAHDLANTLDGPELTVALRKLLEAKDCAVRAALPATEK